MNLKRIEYIDELRGLAILLVIMGHALEHNGYKDSSFYSFIYSFHMPLFFCISGFVTMYSCRLDLTSKLVDFVNYLWRKFLAIMIPYFVWSLIVSPFFFADSFSTESFQRAIRISIVTNESYWFLPCLYILIIYFCIWKFILCKTKTINVILDIFLIVIIGILGSLIASSVDFFRSASSYIIPFFIGVMMSKYERFYNLIVNNKVIYCCAFIIFCLLVGYFGTTVGIINKVIRLSTGLLAIPILFHFFSSTSFDPLIKKTFSIIGIHTLLIYVLHNCFINNLPIPGDMGIWSQLVVFGIIALLISFTCICISKLIEKSPILSLLLLGKRVK
jgi:fucose 4-O-acetylase-like acetyltransferase